MQELQVNAAAVVLRAASYLLAGLALGLLQLEDLYKSFDGKYAAPASVLCHTE